MDRKAWFQVMIVGIALFSMFFGGGNLTFPLWCGIQTSSLSPTIAGFLISGVMLPFYGVLICLLFKGDYEKLLGVWGKKIGWLLIFSLLVFWIPLGSGPRCNQLAYGAYSQIGGTLPFWAHGIIYSLVVFFLTYRKNKILDILGNYITPVLLLSLMGFVWLGMDNHVGEAIVKAKTNVEEFSEAFSAGYYTMDFIAAIFFTSSIITLIQSRPEVKSQLRFASRACMISLVLLSVVYIGMMFVGQINADLLREIPRDQLLAALGRAMFHENYHPLVFLVITLSCLTTSVALALVFSDYLRVQLFKEKLSHNQSLLISIGLSYAVSTIGFEALATVISVAMSTLYPFLLVTTTAALIKRLYQTTTGSLEEQATPAIVMKE